MIKKIISYIISLSLLSLMGIFLMDYLLLPSYVGYNNEHYLPDIRGDFIEKAKNTKISGKYAQMFSNKKVLKIINIGHLQYQKGQDLLIKAVSKIKNIPFYLFIIGEGEQRNYLENLIDELVPFRNNFRIAFVFI